MPTSTPKPISFYAIANANAVAYVDGATIVYAFPYDLSPSRRVFTIAGYTSLRASSYVEGSGMYASYFDKKDTSVAKLFLAPFGRDNSQLTA